MMLIGHQKKWQFLKKTAELERLPHAFLFSGPSQIGKKTFALEFIKLLNCQNQRKEVQPCQTCQNCQTIEKGLFPDLKIIEPRDQGIQISQIRNLGWHLSLRPSQGKIKAAIIDKAQTMNQEAQSAFLKVLEEPKGRALLILITENPERLLPTIISRCESLRFHLIPQKEIKNCLYQQGVSSQKIKEILGFSFGKPGLALSFLANPEKLEIQKKAIKEITSMIKAPLNTRFQYAKTLSEGKQNLKEILESWLRFFREVLIKKVNNRKVADRNFSDYPLNKLIKIIKLLEETSFLLSITNINPRLALEVLLMEI